MYNRKLSDSNFLLEELAKLDAVDLMRYIHKFVPLQSFRSVHYEEKIRHAKLNPKDYICFALATNNIRLLNNGKLQKCIDWLAQESAAKNGKYDTIIRSLQTIWNVKDVASRAKGKVTKDLLVLPCYQNLHRAQLQSAELANTDFRLAMLRAAELQGADLRFANFSYVEMEFATLWGADLSNIEAKYANMTRCVFTKANLQRANLQNAQLQSAKMVNARLFHANLANANLVAANLEKADLRGANLIGAHILNTEFTGANLAGAKFFNRELLTNEKLVPYLNRLHQMLRGNTQLKKIRQYIAIDLSNEAKKLSPKQCMRVLQVAYNHRLFQHIRNRKTVSLINTLHGLFRPNRRLYLETKAQLELARHMPEKRG